MPSFPGREDHNKKSTKSTSHPSLTMKTVLLELQSKGEKKLLIYLTRKLFKKQKHAGCRKRKGGCAGKGNALLTHQMKKLQRKQQLVVNCRNGSRIVWNNFHHQKLASKARVLYLARNPVKENSSQTLRKMHLYLLHHRKWKNTQHLN